jgi:hypothetical protein
MFRHSFAFTPAVAGALKAALVPDTSHAAAISAVATAAAATAAIAATAAASFDGARS